MQSTEITNLPKFILPNAFYPTICQGLPLPKFPSLWCKIVVLMNIYPVCHGVSFYPSLLSFCLYFQKGKKHANWCWKACRKGVDKFIMSHKVSHYTKSLMHLAVAFMCITSSLSYQSGTPKTNKFNICTFLLQLHYLASLCCL